jgi:hypothetical protein
MGKFLAMGVIIIAILLGFIPNYVFGYIIKTDEFLNSPLSIIPIVISGICILTVCIIISSLLGLVFGEPAIGMGIGVILLLFCALMFAGFILSCGGYWGYRLDFGW